MSESYLKSPQSLHIVCLERVTRGRHQIQADTQSLVPHRLPARLAMGEVSQWVNRGVIINSEITGGHSYLILKTI